MQAARQSGGHPPPLLAHPRPELKTGTASQSSTKQPRDPFYGHEDDAKMCAAYLVDFFGCTGPTSAAISSNQAKIPPPPPLANFIAYILHRTEPCVMTTALLFLDRLKSQYPNARGSCGHRLFLTAYMIASKVLYDDTYDNISWSILGQGMFALHQVNQMERELCLHLNWDFRCNTDDVADFEGYLRDRFLPPTHPPRSGIPRTSRAPAPA
ncbi:hypothetical protein BKA62DRAFT_676362 [Auriculariales sp. MPI-PUGE-AT-0066]|nr:hypothetical protein BKA62DRAFT_676362 [Auriculariales sp. MPI-PUGE-AT-0066]